jgi:group I intron endonuclease
MKISGIYQIQSKHKPERIYIGSAINISERWRLHLLHLKRNTHHSKKLQNHFNKYGECDLLFSIILGCDKIDLLKTEQYFLDSYNPFFNIAKIAGSCLGIKRPGRTSPNKGKTFNEEWRKHMKENSGTRGIEPFNKGKQLSIETKKKISESHMGKSSAAKGKKWSDEAKLKFSLRMKGVNNPFFGKTHSEETKLKISKANTKSL